MTPFDIPSSWSAWKPQPTTPNQAPNTPIMLQPLAPSAAAPQPNKAPVGPTDPVIEKVIQLVGQESDVPSALSLGDAQSLGKNRQKLVERAKQEFSTKEKFSALAREIRETGSTHQPVMVPDPYVSELEIAAKELEAHASTLGAPNTAPAQANSPVAAPPAAPSITEVADILDQAAAAKDDSILGQVQSTLQSLGGGAMSMAFRAYIQMQRMILAIWPGMDPIAANGQLDALERTYGKWFGSAEMTTQLNDMLKANNIKIVSGKEDDMGYVKLRGAWKAELKDAIKDKDDEEKELITSKMTLDAYLTKKIEAYVKKYPRSAEAGKEHRTTLMGIFLEHAPKTETVNIAPPTI